MRAMRIFRLSCAHSHLKVTRSPSRVAVADSQPHISHPTGIPVRSMYPAPLKEYASYSSITAPETLLWIMTLTDSTICAELRLTSVSDLQTTLLLACVFS